MSRSRVSSFTWVRVCRGALVIVSRGGFLLVLFLLEEKEGCRGF